jgi:hypothetical protein
MPGKKKDLVVGKGRKISGEKTKTWLEDHKSKV